MYLPNYKNSYKQATIKNQKLYVITGGPGVGKTTLLNYLDSRAFTSVPEDAREIIKNQVKIDGDGLPWKNKILYAQLMLKAAIDSYDRVVKQTSADIVFFDRGILDIVCYMDMENIPIQDDLNMLVNLHPYQSKVFILPPWEEIYETDNERKQTWDEAVFTFVKMKETYLKYGYDIIEVPKCSVEERGRFVLDCI